MAPAAVAQEEDRCPGEGERYLEDPWGLQQEEEGRIEVALHVQVGGLIQQLMRTLVVH